MRSIHTIVAPLVSMGQPRGVINSHDCGPGEPTWRARSPWFQRLWSQWGNLVTQPIPTVVAPPVPMEQPRGVNNSRDRGLSGPMGNPYGAPGSRGTAPPVPVGEPHGATNSHGRSVPGPNGAITQGGGLMTSHDRGPPGPMGNPHGAPNSRGCSASGPNGEAQQRDQFPRSQHPRS